VTELLKRAFEMAAHLSDEEQDALAAWVIERIQSMETLETFLGDALHRPPPTEEEMAELRRMAETEPGLAAALRLAEGDGLDVETILAIRNA
jgi:nucleotide-binding universal stress UspA family protein